MYHPGAIEFQIGNETDVMKGYVKKGSFEETTPEIEKLTGKKNYDVEMCAFAGQMTVHAALCKDGKRMLMPPFVDLVNPFDDFYWISEEELKEIQEAGDDVKSMSCQYKFQPENQGKLIWISGPPGSGKSTTGQLLARKNGFVYYEADCHFNHANPYVPLDVENPSMAQNMQKHLKGITQERVKGAEDGYEFFFKLVKQELDEGPGERFYKFMSKCINYEQNRIGGDWVIAQAVPTRKLRDGIRENLGKEVLFFCLTVDREANLARLRKRHGDGDAAEAQTEMCMKIGNFYELKASNEDNTFDIIITKDMTPDYVAQKIMAVVNGL